MVCGLSAFIVELLCNEQVICEEDKEFYAYGSQITLANMVNAGIMMAVGIFRHALLAMLIFYLVFVSLRFYCGGYHAASYFKCFLMFALTCIFCLQMKEYILGYGSLEVFMVISTVLLGLCIYRFAPIDHDNRRLTVKEKKSFRKQCWLVYVSWSLIHGCLLVSAQKQLSAIFSATFILVSIFMLIEQRR